jgi:hypothetical protein
MAFTELQRAHIAKLFTSYCKDDPRPAVRAQVRHGFSIKGNTVELFESRPAYLPPHDWRNQPVAKFRYVQSRRVWQLYCQFRDLKWHLYEPLTEARTIDALLDEVEADPTGIFWG